MSLTICEDDIVLSVIYYLKNNTDATATIKDVTGASGFVTGTFAELFPAFGIELRDMQDMEDAELPVVTIQKLGPVPGYRYFGAASYSWVLSFEIDARYRNDDSTVDADLSLAQRYQVEAALFQIFHREPYIPLYSFTYDGEDPVENGSIQITNWEAAQMDGYTIVGGLMVNLAVLAGDE